MAVATVTVGEIGDGSMTQLRKLRHVMEAGGFNRRWCGGLPATVANGCYSWDDSGMGYRWHRLGEFNVSTTSTRSVKEAACQKKGKTGAIGGGVTRSSGNGRRWAILRSWKVAGGSTMLRRRSDGGGFPNKGQNKGGWWWGDKNQPGWVVLGSAPVGEDRGRVDDIETVTRWSRKWSPLAGSATGARHGRGGFVLL